MNNITDGWVWLGFSVFLIFAISLDTFLLGNKLKRPHESMRAALVWSLLWIATALIFNVLLYCYLYYVANAQIAHEKALNFFTGYLIEKSLSVDNLFVFYMIFSQFHVPLQYQHRVLSYGIWGAIILRLLLITLGVWLIVHFHWILYLMGGFLFLTGLKILLMKEKEKDLSESLILKLVKKCCRLTTELHQEHFFVIKSKLIYATPLFLVLVLVEFSDLIFALDSIPAIFAITQDPFVVWSSNIFAILGLRAMYFLLAGAVDQFHLLKYAIALILMFVGVKMLVAPWWLLSVEVSLGFIIATLLTFVVLSLPRKT